MKACNRQHVTIRVALARSLATDIERMVGTAMPSILEQGEADEQEQVAKDFEVLEDHTEAEFVIGDVDPEKVAETERILTETSREKERKKRAENRGAIPKYRIEQQNLLHQPSEPSWRDAFAGGKVKKNAATRVVKKEDTVEDEAPKEEEWGV